MEHLYHWLISNTHELYYNCVYIWLYIYMIIHGLCYIICSNICLYICLYIVWTCSTTLRITDWAPGKTEHFGSWLEMWPLFATRIRTMAIFYLPSGYVKIAIENGPVEIVDFPMNSMVDLSIATLNYQRLILSHVGLLYLILAIYLESTCSLFHFFALTLVQA